MTKMMENKKLKLKKRKLKTFDFRQTRNGGRKRDSRVKLIQKQESEDSHPIERANSGVKWGGGVSRLMA